MILAQLVLGYRSVKEVAKCPEVEISPGAIPVLTTLFPKTIGYIWWSDRF